MLKLPIAIEIRERFKNGEPLAKISRDLGVDRKTVRKYAYMRNFPPVAVHAKRTSILDPYKHILDDWVKGNLHLTKREQKTAADMWKDLVSVHGYTGSYPTVQKYVKKCRAHITATEGAATAE